jgi:hypothetical protein
MRKNNNQSSRQADTRWKLKIIFIYYASFADRNNFKFLKTQNYRRFLIDSETVKSETEFPCFDIAFRKINSSAITYEQFLELIPDLASKISPLFSCCLQRPGEKLRFPNLH